MPRHPQFSGISRSRPSIRAGYSVIVESDDDNIPCENWPTASLVPEDVDGASHFVVGGSQPFNPYQLFTDVHVWARPLPVPRTRKTLFNAIDVTSICSTCPVL
jgi:hypothetical protein